jgi:hypothetical protein
MVKRLDADTQDEIKHATLHWTACYEEACHIHRESKEGAGWMPTKGKALSREAREEREQQFHNSLSGRRCRIPNCDVPHHKDWTQEKEDQEKEERHRALEPQGCLRNHCEYHFPTKQVATVQDDETIEIVPYLEFTATINGRGITAFVDSGSHGNFLDPSTVKELGLLWGAKARPYRVTGCDGSALGQEGMVTGETALVTYKIQGTAFVDRFDILPMASHQMMLGMPWLAKYNPYVDWSQGTITFGLQTPSHDRAIMQVQRVEGLPEAYQDMKEAFQEKTTLPDHQEWDHTIPLKEGTELVKLPTRKMDEVQAKVLRKYIDESLEKGWIEESSSPIGYPPMFVPKKDGSPRCCIDYRDLNNKTVKDSHPLPLISEIQDRIAKAKIFTKLDIKDAYHQVRIRKGEEWKTAFRCRYGTFQYKVMPFGLTNAPASFQRLINTALKGYLDEFCTAYLDDVIIYSEKEEEHQDHVRKVLERLIQWKLPLKLKKCEFNVKKTEFLGHILEPGRISMDPRKVASILEWPEPKNVKDVQSFMGLGNYYRKFIRAFSRITAPLTNLTKAGKEFRWEKEEREAFKELKKRFTTAPVLQLYNPERQVVIETDASDFALGGCLNQADEEGKLHPVAFHSRKFIAAEINYDVHDKELLAIVEAVKTWEIYLLGSKHETLIYTDHKNLQTFMTTKELTRRHMRWAERLGQVKIRIIYRKGSENARADALSRRPDYQDSGVQQLYQLFKEDTEGREVGSIRYANPQVMQVYQVKDKVDKELIQAYEKDSMYQELKERAKTERIIHETPDGYIRYFGKIYVPSKQVERIIRMNHDAPGAGHQGYKRTHDRLKNRYYFPKMKQRVREHLDTCVECLLNKPTRHRPYGEMGEYHIPEQPFEGISMDWIVKLPKSKDPLTNSMYDSIMVVVCRLTKYGKFIPYLESSSTEALAYTFTRDVIADHGMPKVIISDRDKWLTSKFWQSLMKQMGSKQMMTSAYHPQANGAAERLNQTLEQYLRCYLNYKQDNWVKLLPLAQYAYNSTYREGTGITPFEALYGRIPDLYNEPLPDSRKAQKAEEWTTEARELQQQLQEDLKFDQIMMAKYYNKGRLPVSTLEEGEEVLLLRKNITTRRPNDKLDHIRIGPFKIKKKVGRQHYELELPDTMKIHPIFHRALLEKAPEGMPQVTNIRIIEPQEDEYEVEKIMGHRQTANGNEYLTKWKGFSHAENTWEPEGHFQNSKNTIKSYHQALVTGKTTSQREAQNQ